MGANTGWLGLIGWCLLSLAVPVAGIAGHPTGSLDEFGTEYYRFSVVSRAVNLRLVPSQRLPEPPGVSAGVAAAMAPRVAMLLDTPEEGVFHVRNVFRIRVRTSSDAYLQVIDVGTSGSITELFPKGGSPLLVKRSQVLTLDGTEDDQWAVEPPKGTEWILAVATSRPITIAPELLAPCSAGDAARVTRLQKLKEDIKAHCRKEGVDVGFQERDVSIVDAQSLPSPSEPAPP